MIHGSKYSENEISTALLMLDQTDNNYEDCAAALHVDIRTLKNWQKKYADLPAVKERFEREKQLLPADLLNTAQLLILRANKELNDPNSKIPLRDIFLAIGITVDKIQLLTDNPTSITQSTANSSVEKQIAELSAALNIIDITPTKDQGNVRQDDSSPTSD